MFYLHVMLFHCLNTTHKIIFKDILIFPGVILLCYPSVNTFWNETIMYTLLFTMLVQ